MLLLDCRARSEPAPRYESLRRKRQFANQLHTAAAIAEGLGWIWKGMGSELRTRPATAIG
jgi:hypothetical protein